MIGGIAVEIQWTLSDTFYCTFRNGGGGVEHYC